MENVIDDNIYFALENVDDSNYIDKIINHFSYEDRLNFFNKMCYSKEVAEKYNKVFNKMNFILTSDEIVEIIKTQFRYETVGKMVDSSYKKYLIYLFKSLDIDNKVKEFLMLDKSLMIYICNYVFDTDALKFEFISRIDKTEDSYNFLYRVINSIISNIEDYDIKLKCVDAVSKMSPDINLSYLIENIDENKFDHYFSDLDLSDITKSNLILGCRDSQKAKKYFLKLGDSAKINASRRFNVLYIDATNKFFGEEDNYLDKNFSFDDMKEMLFSFKDINTRISMIINYDDELKLKFLPFLSEEEKIKVLSNMCHPELFFNGLNYLNSFLSITRALTFYKGEFPKYNENYRKLITYYSKINNVNTEHLIELSKITSLEIINSLSNNNIKSLINMNDNDFSKFTSFFNQNNTKLTWYTLNNIFDAFANKSFNLNYEYIMHYCTNVLLYCQKGDEHNAKKIIKKVLYELDENLIKDYNVNNLYDALVENNSVAKKDFREFCSEYINILRKQEVEISVNMYKDEYLDETYEVSSAIKTIMEYGTSEWIYNEYLSKMMDLLTPREKGLLDDKDLFNQIYEFKLNPTQSPPPIIKTNLFVFNKIMDKFYDKYKNNDIISFALKNSSVKRVPLVPDTDVKFLIDIMSYLNADELKKKLLDDDNLCKDLNALLKKYSFLAFNKRFEEIQLDADTYCDAETVSSVFLNYKDIIKGLKKTNTPVSMSSILDSADTYNKSSIAYKYIFGEDNFKLITLNPPLNRANSLRQERRENSLVNYIRCFNREKVAIPSFDEEIDINTKKINAVVGNFTNPINLTLGERTGSCMRSGGIGDDLYNFCLKDNNGFHIIFNDSETGEFISRASGFRNGNTVFLNQLRESVLDKYNSDDLMLAIQRVSNEIIERSKESNHPIDNVVISHEKAMEDWEQDTINVHASNIFYGMSHPFWFDLNPNNAILLASSSNGSLVPLDLGNHSISYYPVQRDKVRLADNPIEAVNHIEAIDQLLSGKRIEDIKLLEDEFEVCYYGEDWYVAIGKDGNILKKVMRKSKDFESAFKEMEIVLNNLENVENIFVKNKL